VWGILEDVVLLALGASDDFVDFTSDGNESIDESVNLVFGLRLCGFNQPTPESQLYQIYWWAKTYVEIGH
jgi:hypothetical protein